MINPPMPQPAAPSFLVQQLPADIPSDALVVRGYLGRSDLLDQVKQFLAGKDDGAAAVIAGLPAAVVDARPWRLYLSPKLDRYVEFDWSNVLAWTQETELDREDAYTVWLRTSTSHDGCTCQVRYRVVEVCFLASPTGFVRGDLIEDYMSRPEARTVVWDEQEFGPLTGRTSDLRCSG